MVFNAKNWYDNYYREEGHRDHRRADIRYSLALERAPVEDGMKVVDIGCALGTLWRKLEEVGVDCRYIGVDIIDREITELPLGQEIDYRECDITKGVDLPDSWADRVFCLEVIEHVREPMAALEEIARVLKPDGIGVVSVPNPYFWDTILSNILRNRSGSGHIAAWTWLEMTNLLDFSRLEMIEVAKTYNIIPLVWKGQRKGRYVFGRPWCSFLSHNI